MLESFHVQNFRALKDLKIEKTARINLIVGGNNVGKTTFLEAMHCALANASDAGTLQTAFRRGITNAAQYGASSVSNKASAAEFKALISGVEQTGTLNKTGVRGGSPTKEASLAINVFPEDAKLTTSYFGAVKKKKKKADLLATLQKFDSNIVDIDPSMIGTSTWELRVHTDAEEEVALDFMGQGFNRVLSMYCRIIASDKKIILIDEIELGLHYESIPLVWEAIQRISIEKNIQFFATTHSWECILAASKVFEATPGEFQVIRIERTEDNIKPVILSGDNLKFAIENHWEVR